MNRSELEKNNINQLKDLAYEQGFTREDALAYGDTRKRDTWINLILSGKKLEPVISEESEVSSDLLDDPANENEELRLFAEKYRGTESQDNTALVQDFVELLAKKLFGPDVAVKPWSPSTEKNLPCPDCSGSGEVLGFYGEDYELCGNCDGTGLVPRPLDCDQTTEAKPSQSCLYCGGKGTIEKLVSEPITRNFEEWSYKTVSCPACLGSGISQSPDEPELSQDANSQNCLTCEGKPVYRCSRCEGRGRVEDPEDAVQSVFDCPRCDGSGFRKHHELENPQWFTQIRCPMCGEKPIQDVNTEESPVKTNNPPICSYCDGEGVIDKLFTDDYGQEDYKTVTCPNCHGSGSPHPDSSLEAPNPEIYLNFEAFKAAYEDWRERVWGSNDDIAQTEGIEVIAGKVLKVTSDSDGIAWGEELCPSAEELWQRQEKVSPFSNATEYWFWTKANCYTCDKNRRNPEQCEISEALFLAATKDGLIRKNIFNRMGCQSGKCTEFAPRKNESEWVGGLFVGASANE